MPRQSFFSHFYTEKKKGNIPFPDPSLTLTATLRPDHSTTTHCWQLQCKFATFNTPTLHMYERYVYGTYIYISHIDGTWISLQ